MSVVGTVPLLTLKATTHMGLQYDPSGLVRFLLIQSIQMIPCLFGGWRTPSFCLHVAIQVLDAIVAAVAGAGARTLNCASSLTAAPNCILVSNTEGPVMTDVEDA